MLCAVWLDRAGDDIASERAGELRRALEDDIEAGDLSVAEMAD